MLALTFQIFSRNAYHTILHEKYFVFTVCPISILNFRQNFTIGHYVLGPCTKLLDKRLAE